jgi:hypothetical protein
MRPATLNKKGRTGMNNLKIIRSVSIFLAIQTLIWMIFTLVSMSQVKPGWADSDYVKWASKPDIFFTGNYINAAVLTVAAVMLFSSLYLFLKESFEAAAFMGIVFIPVYGVLNLTCYSIQISLVPMIASSGLTHNDSIFLASQMIQANPQSLTGFINGLAYGILGIPSVIYGCCLIKLSKKYSGFLLLLSGISGMAGFAGYLVNNSVISKGIMAGGVLFFIAVICMAVEFKKQIT